jgi:NCAIR mutase (PurE)-related protein
VDVGELRRLLEDVAAGVVDIESAARALGDAPLSGFADMGFARLDSNRGLRTGDPEVVYGAGKTPEQIVTLLAALRDRSAGRPALATRLAPAALSAIRAAFAEATIDETARCAAVGPFPDPAGQVVVVSAGTSDEPVAAEAGFVVRAFGAGVRRVCDVGVAGLHRVLAERETLADADCLIVVAGMEGALPSVVGGLVGTPIVAVPTSVGYGASFGGIAALLAMLNSCAAGVTVVNIDNGFGAGVFAARVARRAAVRDDAT